MDLCTSVVSQVLVSEYIRRGHLEGHLPRIRAHYATKARAMAAALAKHLPGGAASWDDPQGGFFFWVRLAGPLAARELFKRAVDQGVAFLPGDAFYPDPAETIGPPATGEDRARLCFTFATPEQIEEGARRLAAALA
jgi:2-aminoadipate transaminase